MSGKHPLEVRFDNGDRELELGWLHMASALGWYDGHKVEQDVPGRKVTLTGNGRRLVVLIKKHGDGRIHRRKGTSGDEFVYELDPGRSDSVDEQLSAIERGMGTTPRR